jgi:membrane-bound ClpP family serine protease
MQINETILIIYFLVAVNFLFNRLKDFSCHTQTWLTKNLIAKHLFNVAAIFFVIVLFTRSKPIHPIALIILTFVMYGFFMIITRCDHRFLAVFLISMVIVFLIEAYKSYYKEKQYYIERQKNFLTTQLIVQIFSILIVFIGFFVYLGQKSREYPKWNWRKFWLGVEKCKGNSLARKLQKDVFTDLLHGIKRIF